MPPVQDTAISSRAQLTPLLERGRAFRRCTFSGDALVGLAVDRLELEHCDLRAADCAGLACGNFSMRDCRAERACFDKADIQESTLEHSDLRQASFRNARLNLAKLAGCDLSSVNLEGANLFGAEVSGCKLVGVDLTKTKTEGLSLRDTALNLAVLRHTDFRKARLVGLDLSEADLAGADFTDAVFERCRLQSPVIGPDTRFDGADLRGATLAGLRVDLCSFKGGIVTSNQARELLAERFGMIVDDKDNE